MANLFNRNTHLTNIGTLTAPPNDTGTVRYLQVSMFQGQVTQDKIPDVQFFGFSSNPPLGTNHQLVARAGDMSNAVAVGSNYDPARPRNLLQGETQIHDDSKQSVYLQNKQKIVLTANQEVDIFIGNTLIFSVTANGVHCTVPITCDKDITAGTVSLQNHVNTKVQSGNSNSGPPQQ